MLKEPASPPVPIPYVGFCPLRYWFCAYTLPTTPGALAGFIRVESRPMYQFPRFWEKRAPSNIFIMSVTCDTFQEASGWSKAKVWANMLDMSVTDETSQEASGWSKLTATENMPDMLVTCDTSQASRGLSKAKVWANMLDMSVTCDTFQEASGWSKLAAPRNMPDMSVTCDTFQAEISPLNEVNLNMPDMLVTLLRSGTSAALYTMFSAPSKAPPMLVQDALPHCPMDCSFAAFALLPPR